MLDCTRSPETHPRPHLQALACPFYPGSKPPEISIVEIFIPLLYESEGADNHPNRLPVSGHTAVSLGHCPELLLGSRSVRGEPPAAEVQHPFILPAILLAQITPVTLSMPQEKR